MIEQYAVYDNFLNNPKQIIDFMRSQKYYVQGQEKEVSKTKNNIPLYTDYGQSKLPGDPRGPKWVGYRTRDVYELDSNIHDLLMSTLLDRILGKFFVIKIEFEVESYFHILTNEFTPTEKWFHSDPNRLFAGVLYLSENPTLNSGTILTINDNKVFIENKFNRLVIYNASLFHSVEGCFGESLENSRSTFVFFFKDLSIYSNLVDINK